LNGLTAQLIAQSEDGGGQVLGGSQNDPGDQEDALSNFASMPGMSR
jgi:hypothetical protein